MPQTIIPVTQYSTQDLITIMQEVAAELKAREIPEEYSDQKTRGGVRPTTQPLNP
jgi:hypothetical protein